MSINQAEYLKFLKLHSNPEELQLKDLEGLIEWEKKYPYCQSLRILAVKASEKTSQYPVFLAQAAAFSSDRSVLYRFIHDINHFKTEIVQTLQETNPVDLADAEPVETMTAFGINLNELVGAEFRESTPRLEEEIIEENLSEIGLSETKPEEELALDEVNDVASEETVLELSVEENQAETEEILQEEAQEEIVSAAPIEIEEVESTPEETFVETEEVEPEFTTEVEPSENKVEEALASIEIEEPENSTEETLEEEASIENEEISMPTVEIEPAFTTEVELAENEVEAVQEEVIAEAPIDNIETSLAEVPFIETQEAPLLEEETEAELTASEAEEEEELELEKELEEVVDANSNLLAVDEMVAEVLEVDLNEKAQHQTEVEQDLKEEVVTISIEETSSSNEKTTTLESAVESEIETAQNADTRGNSSQKDEGDSKDNVTPYHDDRMPYTFLWWLNKTRKEYEDSYQPFAKSTISSPPAFKLDTQKEVKKKDRDDLNHQIAENIFHLRGVEELTENIPQHTTVPYNFRRKEFDIIEKFIKEEPQIKPPAPNKIDTENKAKKSSEDHGEVVSETLAKIYVEQMLYHKALDVYKKLSLKFPEKSTYFASQIKYLELKVN